MIDVQEIQYNRKHDIGICSITNNKTQWNESCKDGFKRRQYLSGKPYVVCMNCVNWDGKSKLKQSSL